MMRLLFHGVQLISPWHVEAHLAARRIDEAHLGSVLPNTLDRVAVIELIERLASDCAIRTGTISFAKGGVLLT